MNRRSGIRLSLGAGPLLLLAGCIATAPKLDAGVRDSSDVMCKIGVSACVPVIMPPAMPEAASYKIVSVVAKPGAQGSDVLATRIESQLSKVRIDSQLYYTLVPVKDARREATFEVATEGYSATDGRKVETRCRDAKKILCTKAAEQAQVNCQTRKVVMTATIRLQPVKGRSVATHQESAASEKQFCPGDTGGLPDAKDMLAEVLGQLADKLQDSFAIRSEVRAVRMMDTAAEITNAERRGKFNEAVVFLKAGRLDRSCGVFAELSEIERGSIAVLFNAGFCAEARGNWGQANLLYRAADALTKTPNKEIFKAIQETQLSATQTGR